MNNDQFTKEKKFQIFSNFISKKLNDGFIIIERNDKFPFVILSKKGTEVNHSLNFLFFCYTLGLWSVVWGYLSYKSFREKKILVAIDEDGIPFEEKMLY